LLFRSHGNRFHCHIAKAIRVYLDPEAKMSGACWVELDAHDVNAREFIYRASPDEFRFEKEP